MKIKENFWKEIIYKNGKIDEVQVMKELSDFSYLLEQVPTVYCEVTGGLLSDVMTPAKTILSEFNERFYDKEITQDDIADMLKRCATLEELKDDLKDYFN